MPASCVIIQIQVTLWSLVVSTVVKQLSFSTLSNMFIFKPAVSKQHFLIWAKWLFSWGQQSVGGSWDNKYQSNICDVITETNTNGAFTLKYKEIFSCKKITYKDANSALLTLAYTKYTSFARVEVFELEQNICVMPKPIAIQILLTSVWGKYLQVAFIHVTSASKHKWSCDETRASDTTQTFDL